MVGQHWKFKTKSKYTAPGTPHHNSYAETRFRALAGVTSLMINEASVPRAICYTLIGKVSKTATKLDSLVIVDIDGVKRTQVNHYANVIPSWVKHMRTFDEAATVRTGKDDKVSDRGVTMMFLSYA
jgi:hypothetical protein